MRNPFNPFNLDDILSESTVECNHEKGQGPKVKALQWLGTVLNQRYHLGLKPVSHLETFCGIYTGDTVNSVVTEGGQPVLRTSSREGNTIHYSGKVPREVLETARTELNRYSGLTGKNFTITEE